MVTFKRVSRFADRGQVAERAVAKALKKWMESGPAREFERIPDAKAAGRIVKAAVADFEFYAWPAHCRPVFGLIEVKETQHNYRLARDKLPQLPRMRRRELCGGACLTLILHSTTGEWRVMRTETLVNTGDVGSWNLSKELVYPTPILALASVLPEVFGA